MEYVWNVHLYSTATVRLPALNLCGTKSERSTRNDNELEEEYRPPV